MTTVDRKDVAFLMAAIVAVLVSTHGFTYLLGRSHEAELALDAYQAARDAYVVADGYERRLSGYLGVSERAVRVCLRTQEELEELLGPFPPITIAEARR